MKFHKSNEMRLEKNIAQHLSPAHRIHHAYTRILQAQIPRPRPSNAIGHTLFALYKWQIHKTVTHTRHAVRLKLFLQIFFFFWFCFASSDGIASESNIRWFFSMPYPTKRPTTSSKSDRPSVFAVHNTKALDRMLY